MNPYIGKTLGEYRIVEQIGEGGMATVFKAYQPSMDRYVAVKILPSHFTKDETFLGRFTQEARTLAHLEHPHILPVYGYGEDEGVPYLVMRYIDAGTLNDLLRERSQMEMNEIARITGQVGRALGYAHSQGVIHRDVKPSNVLIDAQGNTFLTDFGIAKLVAGTSQFTGTGTLLGTPTYMAPEQGMGKPLDHRCDIYAMGVMLYEMVTGTVPYEAETPLAVLLKHVNEPLPLPRHVNPDVPDAVERVVLKAMAKAPEDRFQSAEALAETLEQAVRGLPTEIILPKAVAIAPPGAHPTAPTGGPTAVIEELQTEEGDELPRDAEEDDEGLKIRLRHRRREQRQAKGSEARQQRREQRRRRPLWRRIAIGLVVLLVLAAIVVGILSNGDNEEMPGPAPTQVAGATGPATQPTPSEPDALPTVGREEAGWTHYANANYIDAVARQGDFLWAGGEGGLIRWDLDDGTYEIIDVHRGLPANQISDLLVDSEDILWIATPAGLVRFDGEAWRIIDEADGLDSAHVVCIEEGTQGTLWAGTAYGDRGLNYFDGEIWGPPPLPKIPVDFPKPQAIAGNAQVGLIVGLSENGLVYTEGDGWELYGVDDGLPGEHVRALLLADGALLASFEREVMRFELAEEEEETRILPPLSGQEIHAMYEDLDGFIWFAGDSGLNRYDPATQDWERFEVAPGTLPAWATSLTEDDDGLWIGTHGAGVVFYDGESWENDWRVEDTLGSNEVIGIAQTPDGALWFSTASRGITRYDPATGTWERFFEDEIDIFPASLDREGNLWLGEYGQIRRYDGESWQTFAPESISDATVFRVLVDADGARWMRNYDELIRHDPVEDAWVTFTAQDHPVFEDLADYHVTRAGEVWAAGEAGLAVFDGQVWRTVELEGGPESVSDIVETADGDLWVSANDTIYRMGEDRWIAYPWPEGNWIETVAAAPDGSLWVGHDALSRLDTGSGGWETIFTAETMPVTGSIHAIHVTPEGHVWIATSGGVSCYVPGE